jgi:hypothetical protein
LSSVRTSVSGFRPVIHFYAARPRLSAGLIAAGVAASAILASALPASAATPQAGRHWWSVASARHVTAAPATAPSAAPAQQDYTFYDSTTPSEIPAHQPIAAYADGEYAVERSSVSDPAQVIWIDVSGGDTNATALDVEPGDATPAEVAGWVRDRLAAHPGALAIVYTMRSEWAAAKASVATLPASMRAQVRWWIADPTGQPHIVPGSQATQWYWGPDYDINSAVPGF